MRSPTAFVPKFAYVGFYTSKERNGRGEGIPVYQIDAGTGNWTHLQLLKGIVNPSLVPTGQVVKAGSPCTIVFR